MPTSFRSGTPPWTAFGCTAWEKRFYFGFADTAHGKSLNTALRRGDGNTLLALVLSITDVNPIPTGPVYCCSFRARRETGCCPIGISGVRASDPLGNSLPTTGLSGSICTGHSPLES